jgi:hypothetical protein
LLIAIDRCPFVTIAALDAILWLLIYWVYALCANLIV